MKKLFAKKLIMALATLNQVQVSASEGKTAGARITCSGKGESELTFANGQIQFPDNLQTFQSHVSKMTGTIILNMEILNCKQAKISRRTAKSVSAFRENPLMGAGNIAIRTVAFRTKTSTKVKAPKIG